MNKSFPAISIKTYLVYIFVIWTFIISLSLTWNILRVRQGILEAARTQARATFEKDIIYRRWNAGHGGVYVPVTKTTPPNPYLSHLENRDMTGPSGNQLTLINPAYMTRQVHELEQKLSGVRGHITSLKPIRHENKADPWEKKALEAFEHGELEFASLSSLDGKSYFRLMRPLFVEKACMKCHESQGYKIGDVRGGISASVPMLPLREISKGQTLTLSIAHILLWLSGVLGISIGGIRLKRRIFERDEAQQKLKIEKEKVEAAYSELKKTQIQLMQSDKMASIGQLAAGIAHEINNPIGFVASNLNVISGYAEDIKTLLDAYQGLLEKSKNESAALASQAEQISSLLEEKEINFIMPDLKNILEESSNGTQRIQKIVSDLRDFSHIDQPDKNKEDLNDLLDKTLNVLSGEIQKTATVVRKYGTLPLFDCYGGKLGQVFLNILSNACQAMEDKGTITVRTSVENNFIIIWISDTGKGISRENMSKIFDPFFTTKDVGQGTGLGLHTAYKIIQGLQGSIKVESEEGSGTTFCLSLPVTGSGQNENLEVEKQI